MSLIYELVGRLVIGALRWRYGRQLRMAAGAGAVLAGVGIAAYLATRDEETDAV